MGQFCKKFHQKYLEKFLSAQLHYKRSDLDVLMSAILSNLTYQILFFPSHERKSLPAIFITTHLQIKSIDHEFIAIFFIVTFFINFQI